MTSLKPTAPLDGFKFRFRCSYQGTVWYDVWDATGMYELALRRAADPYERKFYNGDDADWQRNVVDMIGVLHRAHGIDREVPAETLYAFNAWTVSEHVAWIAKMKADPGRYGVDVEEYAGKHRPTLARAAARFDGRWIITSTIATTEKQYA